MMPITRARVFALVVGGLVVVPLTSLAADISPKKQTDAGLYVTAATAAQMLTDPTVLFVDVRSQAEVAFLGLPQRANVNIPLMTFPEFAEFDAEKGEYLLEPNAYFVEDFVAYAESAGIGPDHPIILFCRSGSRSAKAANLLAEAGYTQVYTMLDGYEGDKAKDGPQAGQRVVNGWKNEGLGWSYRIETAQLYPGDR